MIGVLAKNFARLEFGQMTPQEHGLMLAIFTRQAMLIKGVGRCNEKPGHY